jgi:CDP-diacylglycerol---serine O-phosphatidyltransferase
MKKGIYILPSLFTLGNLACGFASIIFSIEGDFTKAAWLILIAGVFDLFDGRIARMTNTTSQFGVEFDSLADMVSSGVAPAVMIYNLALYTRPTWGLIISLIFVVAGALRLARFNSTINDTNQNYFQGLPLPAAAGVLASFVMVYGLFEREVTKKTIPIIMHEMPFLYKMIPLLVLLLSYLMVSNIKYSSLKKIKLGRPKTFHNLIMIFIVIILIWRFPENMLMIVFSGYLLSGLIGLLLRIIKFQNIREKMFKKKS